MPKHIQLGLLATSLLLAACGSDDASLAGGDDPVIRPPIPVPTKISGVWTGTTRDSSQGLTADETILIFTTGDGVIRIVALEFAIQARGSFDLEGVADDFKGTAEFTADLIAFAPQGFFFGDNTVTVDCAANVTVVGKQTLDGTYDCKDSDSNRGVFSTTYSDANDTLASAEIVSGTWNSEDQSLVLSVDEAGRILGTLQLPNQVSCNWTGDVIPVPEDNLYSFNFSLAAENCGSFAGNYVGLGTIIEIPNAPDRLVFQADSGRLILANELFSNQ
jgi:hypothetical protein